MPPLARRAPFAAVLFLIAVTAGPPRAPIELAETRPVETTLGVPELREARGVWLEMIRGARRRLDLEHFYLSHRPGEALEPVLDELGRAARRGVRVRLLLDAMMYRTYPQMADSLARLPNITVRRLDVRRLTGGVQHAKFMIADGRSVWLGSQNLDWRALSHIHELGVRVDHPQLAQAYGAIFETDWAAAGDTLAPARPAPLPPLDLPVAVVHSPGDTVFVWPGASPRPLTPAAIPWDRDLLLARLDAARSEIAAQVLHFGTHSRGESDTTLAAALRRAAGRGVRVRLLVSDWTSERSLEALRALAAIPGVEVRISRVPDWSGGYIPFARVQHAKFAVVDRASGWIGTSNWEPGYFTGSRNVGLAFVNRRIAKQLQASFESGWGQPEALVVTPTLEFRERVHGMEAPAGVRVHGE